MGFLEISNISKLTDGKSVVDEVSFSQSTNQKIAIAGETGSGKSTLLKMIAGLVPVSYTHLTLPTNREV